jgi:hypothetical protein
MVCAPLISLSLPMTLNDFQFLSNKSNSNNGAQLALHDSCGWLAYVLFLIVLMLVTIIIRELMLI